MICSNCVKNLESTAFTKSQLDKSDQNRKCIDCNNKRNTAFKPRRSKELEYPLNYITCGKYPTKISKSSVHGRGVFANEDIPIGKCICMYDGIDVSANSQANQQLINTSDKVMHWPNIHNKYRVGFDEPKTWFGTGQLINDYAMPKFPFQNEKTYDGTILSLRQIKYAFDMYELESLKHRNMCFDPTRKFYMVATRDIKENEELFFHYGVGYWLAHYINHCKFTLWKLMFIFYADPTYLIKFQNATEEEAGAYISLYIHWDPNSDKWLSFGIPDTASNKEKLNAVLDYLFGE